jgi:tetratricopeptide (TPR) repeat protein
VSSAFPLTLCRNLILFALCLLFVASRGSAQEKQVDAVSAPLHDWTLIEKEYKALRADRDNILAQVKVAYDERNKALEELAAIKAKTGNLVSNQEVLEQKVQGAEQEKAELSEKISQLENESKELAGQLESLQNLTRTLTQENQELLNRNRVIQDIPLQIPKNMMAVVKERDRLIKESADMHYNLGVLLTKNGDYRNAHAEFLRAIQLRPNDSASYFNLGKINADYFKDKEKAITFFQKYLHLEPKADDRGWVEGFISQMRAWRADEKIAL